jgi:uncharacterized protein (DUF1684 family)
VHAQNPVDPSAPAAYDQEIAQWRTTRLKTLQAPDGWLSLIGLQWLKAGVNRIGSAADNDIVLLVGPAHLGSLTLDKSGDMHMVLAGSSVATVDGIRVSEVTLVDDAHVHRDMAPTTLHFGHASFFAIDRDGRKALRVKDSDAATRKLFAGLDYFPIDPLWRIVADWVPFSPPHELQIGNEIGTLDTIAIPGKAVFQRDGHSYELMPYQEEPGGELFFVIADRTSGKETYGASRFFYAALPEGGLDRPGEVILDFNKAYNPPCAFTAFATCPLPPPENRLDLRVTAGEKKYFGGPR